MFVSMCSTCGSPAEGVWRWVFPVRASSRSGTEWGCEFPGFGRSLGRNYAPGSHYTRYAQTPGSPEW